MSSRQDRSSEALSSLWESRESSSGNGRSSSSLHRSLYVLFIVYLLRLSRTIIGRAQLQQATQYFVNSHSVLAEHLQPNSLLSTKVLR